MQIHLHHSYLNNIQTIISTVYIFTSVESNKIPNIIPNIITQYLSIWYDSMVDVRYSLNPKGDTVTAESKLENTEAMSATFHHGMHCVTKYATLTMTQNHDYIITPE